MGPIDILNNYGVFFGYTVSLLIGMGFGAALEMSGFGDSRILAGQFYLRDMTVLKVMFTAIIVAMTLIFFFSSIGLMAFERIFVNPTYLWPGILGGIIMGFGFIIGGFCPGTSIVAMSTFKLDGLFFVVGTFFGVFLFGETVGFFTKFFNSSYLGRFTLPEFLGLDPGITIIMVILMAIMMFYGGELSEQFFGEKKKWKSISLKPTNSKKVLASGILIFVALITFFIGQPDIQDRWDRIKAVEDKKIENREIFVHPGELLEVMNDNMLNSILVDVRPERDFNIFHLLDSKNITPEELEMSGFKGFMELPPNTVIVLISNDETKAVEVYKWFLADGIINVYILSGGINNWLNTFTIDENIAKKYDDLLNREEEKIAYHFTKAVGSTVFPANPLIRDIHYLPKLTFVRRVKVEKKQAIAGGCD